MSTKHKTEGDHGKHTDGTLHSPIESSRKEGRAKRQDNMSHTIKHRADCRRVFNRYDMDCERCRQLAGGDKARPGWGDMRRKAEAQRLQAIAQHDFAACARVNIVCTHFEH